MLDCGLAESNARLDRRRLRDPRHEREERNGDEGGGSRRFLCGWGGGGQVVEPKELKRGGKQIESGISAAPRWEMRVSRGNGEAQTDTSL